MSFAALRARLNLWLEDSWFFSEQIERQLLSQSLAEVAGYAKGTLLDVGCGSKPYKALFGADRHIGLDYPLTVDEHMSASYVRPQVDVYGSGEALPFAAELVDTALCTQVLEHTPDPDAMISEIARVLKPGGYLILTAPLEWGLHQEPHDYYRYTKYGLEHLAKKHGLGVVSVRNRGGFWAVVGQRWSAYLYDTYSRPLRRKGRRLAYVLSALITLPGCALTQLVALALDRLQPLPNDTLGYIMVARKPEGAGP